MGRCNALRIRWLYFVGVVGKGVSELSCRAFLDVEFLNHRSPQSPTFPSYAVDTVFLAACGIICHPE